MVRDKVQRPIANFNDKPRVCSERLYTKEHTGRRIPKKIPLKRTYMYRYRYYCIYI